MRLGKRCTLLLFCMAFLPPAQAGAARTAREHVSGGFVQAAQCIPTGGAPREGSSTTYDFECDAGTTTWTGDLRGQTVLTNVRGTVDLLSGVTTGTADETIHLLTPDGRTGTLEMVSTFTVYGIETFVATNEILRGTGDFAGATGELRFAGAVFGTGTYEGWVKTRSRPQKLRQRQRARR